MKQNILILLSLCLVMLSCSKDEPYLSINQTEVTISETGHSKLFFLEADRNWIATSSETWCSVYPSAGDINNTHSCYD